MKKARKQEDAGPPPTNSADLWICVGIVVTTLACYARIGTHQFINLDDPKYFFDNAMVAAGLTAKSIGWAFTTFFFGNWHPITWLSHMTDVQFFGMKAGPILAINLLLHILNSLLVYGVFRAMALPVWRCGLVAGLFALHPMHVESVAWASERKDVLSTFFAMICLYAYIRYARGATAHARRFYPVVIFLALSLMTKSMVVTWPFVMLLLDYWPLQRLSFRPAERFGQWVSRAKPLLWEKVPLFVVIIASSVISYIAQSAGGAVTGIERSPLSLRVANALVSYVRYIALLIWPKDLSVFYPYPPVPAGQALGALAVLGIITIAAILLMRRHQYFIVGWLWFLGTLIPVIGLVKIGSQSMADRYSYTPSIGLFLILAWGLAELAGYFRVPAMATRSAAALWLAVLAILTFIQAGYWKDSITLYKHALAAGTPSIMAHYNLGQALAAEHARDEAIVHFKEVFKLDPNFRDAWLPIGILLTEQGKFEEAAPYLSKAVELDPENLATRAQLVTVLLNTKKFSEAETHLREILRARPENAEAHNSLGVALLMSGKLDNAAAEFSEAVRLKPDFAGAQQNLKAVHKLQGRSEP